MHGLNATLTRLPTSIFLWGRREGSTGNHCFASLPNDGTLPPVPSARFLAAGGADPSSLKPCESSSVFRIPVCVLVSNGDIASELAGENLSSTLCVTIGLDLVVGRRFVYQQRRRLLS